MKSSSKPDYRIKLRVGNSPKTERRSLLIINTLLGVEIISNLF